MRSTFRQLAFVAAVAATALTAPAALHAQAEVYGPDDLTSMPKMVSAAAAARMIARSYPEHLRSSKTGGTVQLQFVIGTDGKVEKGSVEILEAPVPALGNAAKAVAERMEFVPGKKGAAAVRSRVTLPVVYQP